MPEIPDSLGLKASASGMTGAHGAPHILFMSSSGGLKSADLFQGRDAILSGPAGGVVGMAETARLAGFKKVIGFDMGGTSTDVSHFAGEYERSFETEVAGVRLRVPMLRVHTVAAGGGSILAYDGTRFRVGPQSAGADPGPRCYRRGGPLTVTDANVMVGKLRAATFPAIFGPGRDQPLDEAAVHGAFAELAAEIGDGRTPEEVADGFIRIAVENMANAIKKISVQRGYDVTEYALNCFGSAGGQHACLIADTLGMETVLIHPLSGLLSAYGMGLAPIRASREQSVEAPLSAEALAGLETLRARLDETTRAEVAAQGVEAADIAVTAWAHLRYDGTDTALSVALAEAGAMRDAFEALHRQRFGFVSPEKGVMIAALEVEAVGWRTAVSPLTGSRTAGRDPMAQTGVGEWRVRPLQGLTPQAGERPLLLQPRLARRARHPAGRPAHRPPPRGPGARHRAAPDRGGGAGLEPGGHPTRRSRAPPHHAHASARSSARRPTRCCWRCSTTSTCRSPSRWARRCATRRSRSTSRSGSTSPARCSTPRAQLVANAPHMPVHLGSMDRSVETVIRANAGQMRPGDVYMLNAPYNGGTHLPDITVITPVFDGNQGEERPESSSTSPAAGTTRTSAG